MRLTPRAWHERLGHLNMSDVLEMSRKKVVRGMKLSNQRNPGPCSTCREGKFTSIPFSRRSERRTKLLEIVHADVCGPMRTELRGRKKYFVTFIDDCSRWCEIRFLHNKRDVFKAFKEYKAYVEKLTGKNILCLQSDNGGEFTSTEFNTYLSEQGVRRRLTVPYTPQQNGVAERKNRTLMEMARCMLIQSRLSTSFWAEAVFTANYIRNRCISKSLDKKTPYTIWHGEAPNLRGLRTFGEAGHYLHKDPCLGKTDP